jgi:tagatose-1,6-bisphosphate aldolase non-catalytic subunit AgaZ/GatZ
MYQKPEDWRSLFEAMALELPLGLQRLMLGAGEAELEVEEAASKAHHAWVNLASTMVNAVYVRTGFWDFALDALNSTMRAQRLGQAAAKVVVAALGPAIGLASISDVEALQDELTRLRSDFKDLSEKFEFQTGAASRLRRVT